MEREFMEKVPEYININNVAIPTSQKFWDGNRKIEVNEYIRICEVLNVPLDAFAGEEKEVV